MCICWTAVCRLSKHNQTQHHQKPTSMRATQEHAHSPPKHTTSPPACILLLLPMFCVVVLAHIRVRPTPSTLALPASLLQMGPTRRQNCYRSKKASPLPPRTKALPQRSQQQQRARQPLRVRTCMQPASPPSCCVCAHSCSSRALTHTHSTPLCILTPGDRPTCVRARFWWMWHHLM